METMETIETIKAICQEKRKKNILPESAIWKDIRDLTGKGEKELKEELNELCRKWEIGFFRSINDFEFFILNN